ncbi:SubName: Full=Uncharacterized protein {ECO:0000313/EMBL:CCA70906.1} [Serendipita indica DSM 11827]|uniref:WSC domain-containing protein n=1 Tax=Serendipita indica (strain DSM 11827) TaxID=1109443 RepID=G4THV8_SERID|nr:SubName: Full=Uncharacterized protein {ECO:0000313/EMBL:CCA70906.1} [Serendipita indica DSM 11827]CCA70906.1 hypothetical protein PIIN_04842 [Serendipita indica DSM 11827]
MAKTTIIFSATLFSVIYPALALSGHVSGQIDAREIHKRHNAAFVERLEARNGLKQPQPILPTKKRAETPSSVARRDDGSAAYTLLGCYASVSSTTGNEVLTVQVPWNQTSIQTCVAACATSEASPYAYAGVLAGEQCICDNTLGDGAVTVGQGHCNSACAGSNGAEKWCGGPTSFQIYYLPAQETTTVASTASTSSTEETGGTIIETETPSSSAEPSSSATDTPSSTASPVPSSLPTISQSITGSTGITYYHYHCVVDSFDPLNVVYNTNVLRGPSLVSESVTPLQCADFCLGNGYGIIGLQAEHKCSCGSFLFSDVPSDTCADSAIAIYQLSPEDMEARTGPFAQAVSGDFKEQGCFDTDPALGAFAMWTAQAIDGDLSVDKCTSACANAGFANAAVAPTECLCSNDPPAPLNVADRRDCDVICPLGGGVCGGLWRVNVYTHGL